MRIITLAVESDLVESGAQKKKPQEKLKSGSGINGARP